MIRFLLRSCGFLLLAAAFAALLVDGTRSIAGGRLLQYPAIETAGWLCGTRFAAVAGDLVRGPDGVGPQAALVLAVPGWMVFAIAGLACAWAGRRGRRDDVVSRRGA